MNARFIDWIWSIRGSLALTPGQTSNETFERLDPLFRQPGTSREWTGDMLTFSKKDQAAQDKMSIFDGGVLKVEQGAAGPVLHYRMTSRMLLFCFLAPLLFLAFAQLNIALSKLDRPAAEGADKAKKDDKKDVVLPQNPIDKFLGSPASEKPKKDEKPEDKAKEKHSPTSAYVFAAFFALLYVVGRILEAWLIKRQFKLKLRGPE